TCTDSSGLKPVRLPADQPKNMPHVNYPHALSQYHSPKIMLKQLLKPEIEQLLHNENFRELREAVEEWEPSELAAIIGELSDNDDVILFRILPRDQAAGVFEHFSHKKQEDFINALANNKK